MEAERALRSIRGGDVRKEEEEERRESEGSGRHRRGGAKLALLPPIFELRIYAESRHGGQIEPGRLCRGSIQHP